MTREDAILHMTLRRQELKLSVGDLDEDIKAFDMAIEALEQQKVGRWRPYKIEKKKIVFLDDLSKKDARQQQNWEDIYAPFYICSCCGKEDFSGSYCSNCGAKMEEVEE